jgi:hypothetical protein
MAKDRQMCFGCGQRPATNFNGTLPLCSTCAAKAKDSQRGVKFEKPKKPELQA